MSAVYYGGNIDDDDLRKFAQAALSALSRTQYGKRYKDHIAAIALCQGGENHYAVIHGNVKKYYDPTKKGLKDIDIWFFFREKGFHPLWSMNDDFVSSKFGQNPNEPEYKGRRMDIFGRSISFQDGDTIESAIQRWIKRGKNKSRAWYLSKKAIVTIYPKEIRGNVLWVNPDLN